jgi:pimeloyl-ACP methyl ester carboxylesterase
MQPPVIVIPGITATTLHDDYPLNTLDIWTMVLNKDFHRVGLHPDDLRYEAYEPARVYAGKIFAIYNDFLAALRHELSPHADEPTPVFAFPYDWRRPLALTVDEFAKFVEEVIARTRLLRHYRDFTGAKQQVDLVGHSMGGLVICEYLSRHGANRVHKIATLGTPFLGAMEAVVKLTSGLGVLSGEVPSERERETARSTPAVYHLLPSYDGATVDAGGKSIKHDLFDVANWQTSIVESLAEYIRLHAVDPPRDAEETVRAQKEMLRAAALLKELLDAAGDHRRRVEALDLAAMGKSADDWLAVVGLGEQTRGSLTPERAGGRLRFNVHDAVAKPAVNSPKAGDGTVPVPGAIPPFLPRAALFGVSRDDFEWFEFGDKALVRAAGLHALLPNLNVVQRVVIKHLRPAFRGPYTGRPVPGVTKAAWKPPIPRSGA